MLSPRTRPGAGIADLAEAVRGLPTPRAAAGELCGLVREVRYERGITGVHSRGEDAWVERAGVCQDFAHITVGALRSLGVPARYVSGYLVPRRDVTVGETSTGESHAWSRVLGQRVGRVRPDQRHRRRQRPHRRRPRPATTRTSRRSRHLGPRRASLEVSVAITRLA